MGDAHDFDFELGTWSTQLRLLAAPLTGSDEWVECSGTSVVRPLWAGQANLVELTADGPIGRIEALSLRLFNPASEAWSLHVATVRSGGMSPPLVGGFSDGRGEFFGHEEMDGRDVLVRFRILPHDADTIHFEQAFSADHGATWETNWFATDTRLASDDR
ncbi:MAG: hypothetical protein ABI622_05435 [Chloroflexota bacterium]